MIQNASASSAKISHKLCLNVVRSAIASLQRIEIPQINSLEEKDTASKRRIPCCVVSREMPERA